MTKYTIKTFIFAAALTVSAVPGRAQSGVSVRAFQQMGADAVPRSINDKLAKSVSVKDFGAECDGTTLDSVAFQKAINAARVVMVPAGTCLVATINLRAGTRLVGVGADSIVKQVAGASTAMLSADSGSSNTANNLTGIVLRDLQLLGTVARDGFSEHVHLAALSGVTRATIERVTFRGFRGGGLYLGSSETAGRERHNIGVTVRKSLFDGVNNDNRNAISIIDGDGVTIEDNRFVNVTRSNMPGAIDAEPDANTFPIIRNIIVRGNAFDHVGGSVGVMSIFVPATVTSPVQNVTFEDNVVTNYVGGGSMVFFTDNRMPSATSTPNNLKVLKNTGRGGFRPFFVYGKRITIRDNTWTDYAHSAMLAYASTNAVRDLDLLNNRFVRGGTSDGRCLTAFSVDYANIAGNKFIDCGTGTAGSAIAVDFNKGTSSHIAFDSNEFSTPTRKTLVAIQREGAHTFTSNTNRFFSNAVSTGLTNHFQADESDELERPGRRQ
jgi:polygalacturonase